ncbi:MAG TPA: amidohydrolase family protein [Terriglobia bacterium]|nr:amidohydrolase family protein [Terriglobia bacterium]
MKRRLLLMSAAVAMVCAAAWGVAWGVVWGAQGPSLTITNARILDGTGRVIERGAIVVRDGKIASVSAGSPAATGRTIDANGKTVMPGLIDAHRHLVTGNADEWLRQRAAGQFQEFLEAGFTTVLAAIDPAQAIEARKRIDAGQMKGPRLYVGVFIPVAGATGPPPNGDPARTDPARGPLPTTPAPAIPREATIRAVENAVQAGYDYLKVVLNTTQNGPELDTLKLIVAEGKKHNKPTIVHAVSVRDTLAAIEAKPDLLVHTPHIGNLGDDPAAVKKIVDARIPMTSTLAVFVPHFDDKGVALFRDAQPFPWHTLSSAGQGPVNARLLWEAGLVSYGFGTDTQWPPKQTLADELRALRLVFSPQDIVRIITKNAANATMHGAEIGTLEPGKLADIVIIDGDPMRDSDALLNVVTTIKGGEVVFEKK